MDGSVSRVGQDEPAVLAPSRDQTDVQSFGSKDQAREPGGFARVGRTGASREALRAKSRADGEEVGETEGAPGAIAHGEVRHPVHQLVPDDVENRERLLAGLVGRPAVPEYAVAFRAERRACKEGIRPFEVDHGDGPSVRAVDALPAVPRGEVVVGPAGVGVGFDHRRVVPFVVRVGGVVFRRPDRFARRQVVDQVVGEQSQEALEVEPHVQSDDLRRPHPVVAPGSGRPPASCSASVGCPGSPSRRRPPPAPSPR